MPLNVPTSRTCGWCLPAPAALAAVAGNAKEVTSPPASAAAANPDMITRRTPRVPGLTAAPSADRQIDDKTIRRPRTGRQMSPAGSRRNAGYLTNTHAHQTPGIRRLAHTMSGPLVQAELAGGRGGLAAATPSLPAMPDTCTLAAFTEMNSSAEISRLPLAGRDEPGQPGPDRRLPCGEWRWLSPGPAPARRTSAAAPAERRLQAGGLRAEPAEQLRRHRPGAATRIGRAYRGSGPGPNAPTAPRPACRIMSGSSGQPAIIRPGPETPARRQRPCRHDPRVRALTNARRSRGLGPGPGLT